jgi:hypothetical protein
VKRFRPWILICAAIVVACFTADWPAIRFAKFEGSEFISRLGALLIFALLIERTVEVFLTIWRAEEANRRETTVQQLVRANKPADNADLKSAQEELLAYRAETQRWALPISFTLGLLLASFGVRVIQQFLDHTDLSSQGPQQAWWFHLSDIVLTAALLAGGADPIHKVMDAFRKFMEASSARASGTTK